MLSQPRPGALGGPWGAVIVGLAPGRGQEGSGSPRARRRTTDLPCPLTLLADSSLQPGQSWSDPGNPCVTHECEEHRDGLVVVTRKKACPPLRCPAVSSGSPQPHLAPWAPTGGHRKIRPGVGVGSRGRPGAVAAGALPTSVGHCPLLCVPPLLGRLPRPSRQPFCRHRTRPGRVRMVAVCPVHQRVSGGVLGGWPIPPRGAQGSRPVPTLCTASCVAPSLDLRHVQQVPGHHAARLQLRPACAPVPGQLWGQRLHVREPPPQPGPLARGRVCTGRGGRRRAGAGRQGQRPASGWWVWGPQTQRPHWWRAWGSAVARWWPGQLR